MYPGDRLMRFFAVHAGRSVIACVAVVFVATTATSPRSPVATAERMASLEVCPPIGGHAPGPGDVSNIETGGTWYWLRSPEQERRVVMNLYNRYCVRCHGVDGRGVWDIPDVPDFNNSVWQATRPDAYRTRVILEGRGAVMPAFRGTLTLEESWPWRATSTRSRPGTEVSRPCSPPPTGTRPPPLGPPPAIPTLPPPTNNPSPFTH